MVAVRVVPPALEPVTVAEVQAHLRLDSAEDDAWLMSAIRTVRQQCEDHTGRKLVTQTWDVYMDRFPAGRGFTLPRDLSPVQSVAEIGYTPAGASELIVTSSDYVVDAYSVPARVVLKSGASWPADELTVINGVRVQVVCGYGDDGHLVPAQLRHGMLLAIGDLYEYREAALPAGMVPSNKRIPDLWSDSTKVY